jgi:hypothetical protein
MRQILWGLAVASAALATVIGAESCFAAPKIGNFSIEAEDVPCCDSKLVPAIVWTGNRRHMSFEELAAYCGPVLWFSPDEPGLNESVGKDIRIPEAFPFEEAPDAPVVHYRVRRVLVRDDEEAEGAIQEGAEGRGSNMIDLQKVVAINLDYFFYYSSEEGLGGHEHDVESVEMKVLIWRRDDCEGCTFHMVVTRVNAKAHGLLWYDNTIEVDEYTRFPMHILVEEGKHASCTDKNADGYFTPGFDVSERPNDAWGVRDVMRTGALFTAGWEAWMAKVRRDEHRIFPPLPDDSPHRDQFKENGVFAPDNAIYELRPFPTAEKAEPDLVHFIADKGDPDWPEIQPDTDFQRFGDFFKGDSFVKSLAIAYRYDGQGGLSFTFPLFVVRNFEDALTGGFLVNRMYLRDKNLRDFAWTILFTRSASRWMDGYFSAGYEWDVIDLPGEEGTRNENDFVLETGIKFRGNVSHSAFKFLGKITDFWGLRLGVKNKGFWQIDNFSYVVEIGAGTW